MQCRTNLHKATGPLQDALLKLPVAWAWLAWAWLVPQAEITVHYYNQLTSELN